MRTIKLVLFIYFSLFVSSGHAFTLTSPLVDAKWLKENLSNVVVLDVVSDPKYFLKFGHIPRAVPVPWDRVRTTHSIDGKIIEKLIPNQNEFENLMQESGVNDDSAIVITFPGDGSRSMAAGARLYWQLNYYGHDNVSLLNGGNAAWKSTIKAKLDFELSASKARGNFRSKEKRDEILATTYEVENAIIDKSIQLLDTRTITYYLGLTRKSYVFANGHIPTAKLFPHTLLTEEISPSIFYPMSDISKASEALSVNLQYPTIVYCNSGHLASGTWFVMHELLGNTDVKLYDGSMHEWSANVNRPIISFIIE